MNPALNVSPTRYTGRDYQSAVTELSNFIKTTKSSVWSDFYESNLGMALIELNANVVDIASWNTDASFLEAFLATARRYESGYYFAQSVGYLPRTYTSAEATLKSTSVPQSVTSNGCTVAVGASVTGGSGLSYYVATAISFLPGTSVLRIPVVEGSIHSPDVFTPKSLPNPVYTTTGTQVSQDTWSVYVGDATNSNNRWTQVDSVLIEPTASNTYDVTFDLQGRMAVRFGDGTAGAIPADTVTILYSTCNGVAGNAPANTIAGSIQVSVPLVGMVSVPVVNYDADLVTGGQPLLSTNEDLGSTQASATQQLLLAQTPAQPGTVKISIVLPSAAGIIVVQDDGAGGMVELSNTSTIHLLGTNSGINYQGGSITLFFTAPLAAPGGPYGTIVADYTYISSFDPGSAVIVGAAAGGADRESLDQLRVSVPAFIRSSGRLITYQDYNDAVVGIPGVAASFAQVLSQTFSGNVVQLHVWGSEPITFTTSEFPSIDAASATYTRYAQISDEVVHNIQQAIRPRTILTVHSAVVRPSMQWISLYFGDISTDKRVPQQNIRQSIVEAVITYFQTASGFEVRISDLTAAIDNLKGVRSFNLARVTVGTRDTTGIPDDMNSTASPAVPTLSGSVTSLPVSPLTFSLTIQQNGSYIVLVDDGLGALSLAPGSYNTPTFTSGTIDYATGAYSALFGGNLISGGYVQARYADVVSDYRQDQVVDAIDDAWPPSPVGDGKPLSTVGVTSTYDYLKDLTIVPVFHNNYYFDSTLVHDYSTYYDSVEVSSTDVQIFNLRKLAFTLVPS